MNKAVELMVRMYAENRIDPEQYGASKLDRETIVCSISVVAHENPLGYALLSAKYLDDMQEAKKAYSLIRNKLLEVGKTTGRADLLPDVINMAVMTFCQKTLESQRKKLINMWMQHGSQARRSQRIIKTHEVHIEKLLCKVPLSDFRDQQNEKEIQRYEKLIANEQERLRTYADGQAKKTDQCPRCSGTGIIATKNNKVGGCYACNGEGHHAISREHVHKHFTQQMGVSDKLWRNELSKCYDFAVTLCHQEASFVGRQLGEALERERQAC
ncbi:hypothetical protein AB6E53_02380 [Vibrio breoganii]|uniref:Antitermination protein n=1 Tax=Vibrio breoganii TaxID=553239 RepID=A0AAP8MVK2_9VIBR|nr:hypothetical protein [Vibrio breoganii]PMP10235.1 hypothetical protein BCS93_11205 [Vibrio breoganii]